MAVPAWRLGKSTSSVFELYTPPMEPRGPDGTSGFSGRPNVRRLHGLPAAKLENRFEQAAKQSSTKRKGGQRKEKQVLVDTSSQDSSREGSRSPSRLSSCGSSDYSRQESLESSLAVIAEASGDLARARKPWSAPTTPTHGSPENKVKRRGKSRRSGKLTAATGRSNNNKTPPAKLPSHRNQPSPPPAFVMSSSKDSPSCQFPSLQSPKHHERASPRFLDTQPRSSQGHLQPPSQHHHSRKQYSDHDSYTDAFDFGCSVPAIARNLGQVVQMPPEYYRMTQMLQFQSIAHEDTCFV